MRNNANIELIGYVYGEPESPMVDRFPNFMNFSFSVTKKWKDKFGEEQKEVAWYKCQSWSEGLSKTIKNYVKGGMGLLIKGAPKASAYIDKEGEAKAQIEVNIAEMFILTSPQEGWNSGNQNNDVSSNNIKNGRHSLKSTKPIANLSISDIADDDIPF